MSRSFLKLGKEFQGRSYDAMVAHTTIVFCRYIMLALEKKGNEDPQSLGNLYYYYRDEFQDIEFSEALFLLLDILKESLKGFLFLPGKRIREFIDYFISRLPAFSRNGFGFRFANVEVFYFKALQYCSSNLRSY